MYGLIYPAVLGTGLVAVAMQIASYLVRGDADFVSRMSLGLRFLFFFCVSFVAGARVPCEPPKAHYRLPAFGCDLVESLLMFICFLALGLFSQPATKPHLRTAYVIFLLLIPAQLLWRASVGLNVKEMWPLRVLAVAALLFGWLFGHTSPFFTPLVSLFCILVTLIYVVKPRWAAKWFNE